MTLLVLPVILPYTLKTLLESLNLFAGHRLHILCKALQAMTCYICNTIAADILSRISQDEKLNVWTLVEAWFKKLARFLELWGKVELRSEVEGHISSGIINTFIRKAGKGRSPYPLPPLDDLGKLAFRSQVLLPSSSQ